MTNSPHPLSQVTRGEIIKKKKQKTRAIREEKFTPKIYNSTPAHGRVCVWEAGWLVLRAGDISCFADPRSKDELHLDFHYHSEHTEHNAQHSAYATQHSTAQHRIAERNEYQLK